MSPRRAHPPPRASARQRVFLESGELLLQPEWRKGARERAERVGSSCVLRRDFDRGVEVDGSRVSSRRDRAMTWWRNRKAIFAKSTHVDLDRPFDSSKSCVDRLARRDASREIRNRGAPVTVGIAIDLDEILQRFHLWPLNPACRLTEAKVPLGMSSPNAPLTVTRPGFVGSSRDDVVTVHFIRRMAFSRRQFLHLAASCTRSITPVSAASAPTLQLGEFSDSWGFRREVAALGILGTGADFGGHQCSRRRSRPMASSSEPFNAA